MQRRQTTCGQRGQRKPGQPSLARQGSQQHTCGRSSGHRSPGPYSTGAASTCIDRSARNKESCWRVGIESCAPAVRREMEPHAVAQIMAWRKLGCCASAAVRPPTAASAAPIVSTTCDKGVKVELSWGWVSVRDGGGGGGWGVCGGGLYVWSDYIQHAVGTRHSKSATISNGQHTARQAPASTRRGVRAARARQPAHRRRRHPPSCGGAGCRWCRPCRP